MTAQCIRAQQDVDLQPAQVPPYMMESSLIYPAPPSSLPKNKAERHFISDWLRISRLSGLVPCVCLRLHMLTKLQSDCKPKSNQTPLESHENAVNSRLMTLVKAKEGE